MGLSLAASSVGSRSMVISIHTTHSVVGTLSVHSYPGAARMLCTLETTAYEPTSQIRLTAVGGSGVHLLPRRAANSMRRDPLSGHPGILL